MPGRFSPTPIIRRCICASFNKVRYTGAEPTDEILLPYFFRMIFKCIVKQCGDCLFFIAAIFKYERANTQQVGYIKGEFEK